MPGEAVNEVGALDVSGEQQYLWVDEGDRVHAIGPPVLGHEGYATEEALNTYHPAALFKRGGRAIPVDDAEADQVANSIMVEDESTHYPVWTEVLG